MHDWDSTEVPILADIPVAGQPRKVVMFANRNGFTTRSIASPAWIVAKPFVQTTGPGSDRDGRRFLPGHMPSETGTVTSRHHRRHELLAAELRPVDTHVLRQRARSVHDVLLLEAGYKEGERFTGGAGQRVPSAESPVDGALRAIDPATGDRKWEFRYLSPSTAGLLTTASGLIFSGDNDGNLLALDSRGGKLLWRYQMGANMHGTSPITYMLDGPQQLLVPAGTTLTAWALPQ